MEVSRKCKQLRRRRAWALTGTPIENRIDDLVSILEFVAPLKDGEAPLRLTHGPELIERHKVYNSVERNLMFFHNYLQRLSARLCFSLMFGNVKAMSVQKKKASCNYRRRGKLPE